MPATNSSSCKIKYMFLSYHPLPPPSPWLAFYPGCSKRPGGFFYMQVSQMEIRPACLWVQLAVERDTQMPICLYKHHSPIGRRLSPNSTWGMDRAYICSCGKGFSGGKPSSSLRGLTSPPRNRGRDQLYHSLGNFSLLVHKIRLLGGTESNSLMSDSCSVAYGKWLTASCFKSQFGLLQLEASLAPTTEILGWGEGHLERSGSFELCLHLSAGKLQRPMLSEWSFEPFKDAQHSS